MDGQTKIDNAESEISVALNRVQSAAHILDQGSPQRPRGDAAVSCPDAGNCQQVGDRSRLIGVVQGNHRVANFEIPDREDFQPAQ